MVELFLSFPLEHKLILLGFAVMGFCLCRAVKMEDNKTFHDRYEKHKRCGAMMTDNYVNYVVITDDKGNKKAFYNFRELIKYLDSFKMSFLPDGFSYTIHEE